MAIAQKTHEIQVFEVEGSYPFPMDMLRYDQCWPARHADVGNMQVPLTRGPAVTIRLNRAIRSGGQLPTRGRWASFGWSVTRVYAGTDEEG